MRSLIDLGASSPHYVGLLAASAPSLDDAGLSSTGGKMFMIFGKRAFFGYQAADDSSGIWFVNFALGADDPHARLARWAPSSGYACCARPSPTTGHPRSTYYG